MGGRPFGAKQFVRVWLVSQHRASRVPLRWQRGIGRAQKRQANV